MQWLRSAYPFGLEAYAQQAQTGEGVNRMLSAQQAANSTYRLGQLSELSSTGIGMDAMAAAQAQNSLRRSQLSTDFFDTRGGDSLDATYQFGEGLKEAAREQLSLKQQELSIAQATLEARKREKDIVDQRVAGLAGMSDTELRRAERAYQSSLDGSVTRREAETLQRAGMGELQAVKDANLSRASGIAPGLTAYITREVARIQEDSTKVAEEIAALTKEIGKAADGTGKAATGLIAETLALVRSVDDRLETLRQEMEIERKNAGVKNGHGSKAPGGIRGPGQAR